LALARAGEKRPRYGGAADQRNELPPLHFDPLAAEEKPRDYHSLALTASVWCIAIDRRERGLLRVQSRRRSHGDGQQYSESRQSRSDAMCQQRTLAALNDITFCSA
jgi:hypothetical protein